MSDITEAKHYHRCPEKDCGHIWSHVGADIEPGKNTEAHTCPKCKKGKHWMACVSEDEARECDGKEPSLKLLLLAALVDMLGDEKPGKKDLLL